jgi:ribose transport system substrate-binding protein
MRQVTGWRQSKKGGIGYDSVNAMVRIIRQHATATSEDTGVTFLSQSNLNDPKVQAVLHPSCQNPPV